MLNDRAILDFPEGTLGFSGDPVQGRFVLAGNLQISPSFRTGYIIGGAGSSINNVIQQFVGDGEAAKGKGFFLDLGGGAHVVEINFRGWEGARIPTGYDSETGDPVSYEYVQWGNTGDPSRKTYGDTTGADPISQINCLEQYLRHIKIDSAPGSQATLQYGEFGESGMYEPLSVVIEGPNMTRAAEDGSWFDGSMTLIEAAAIDDIYSADQRGAE